MGRCLLGSFHFTTWKVSCKCTSSLVKFRELSPRTFWSTLGFKREFWLHLPKTGNNLPSRVTLLPDWQGRIQFWVEEARTVSGQLALVVTAITSRWFGIGLIGSGIGYLLFVGEPKRAVRHPIWPILGWGVLGVVALAFWTVLVAGYAVVHLPVLTVA